MHKKLPNHFLFNCSDDQKSKTCTAFNKLRPRACRGEPHRSIENLKWLWLSVIAFVLALTGAVAQAQQPKKIWRLGYLSSQDPAPESKRAEAIQLALRERGYIEGQNIAIEYRYAEGKRDRFPELAAGAGPSQRRYHRGISRGRLGPGGEECDQDDSHRYDGGWDRSCQG